MKQMQILNTNRDGWNTLINNNNPFSNTSLPEYGPYMKNEKELKLFTDIKNKKVLELGCASGESLVYLKKRGASELWGLDISEAQINKIDYSILDKNNFFVSPMENNPGIKENYFDYVLSLYSIGYSSDPLKVFELISKYLKKGGSLILCWTHPFFDKLEVEDDKIVMNKSYNDEGFDELYKGQDRIKLLQNNLKISTLINYIISQDMEIDKILEEKPLLENGIGDYKSSYFDERKLSKVPTTLIIVAHKKIVSYMKLFFYIFIPSSISLNISLAS